MASPGTDRGPLVRARDLSRRFRRRGQPDLEAVRGVSFDIAPGEMVGYIGPNGAGKSTTIKMLTGILVPSSGQLRVAGLDPSRQRTELAQRIGVVFGQRTTLWWDLPLRDTFALLQKMYRIPADRYEANLTQQYSALEQTMSALQGQQSYLAQFLK